ncbi:MAG: hypothetical protein IT340_12580 [Chloroflexi bacterium]|nr:hypothetical protein [Chloroflexota bacterium]
MDYAIVREQGVVFGVVCVKHHIVQNGAEAQRTISAFQPRFPGMPVVLMGQDAWGRAAYYGRRDIVRFLASIPVSAIPWRRG